jgi:hypothetical protein
MKKISILIIGIVILVSNSMFSQKVAEFGFYAGTSVTSMSGAEVFADAMTEALTKTVGKDFPVSEAPRTLLFNAGGFIGLNIKPWLTLKGGAEYAPKGECFSGEVYLSTNLNMQSEVLEQSTVFRVGYIDFPVSVQFSTRSKAKKGKSYCYLNLGVSPSMKLFSKMDVKTSLVEKGFNNSGVTSKVLNSDFQSQDQDGIKITDFGMFCSIGVNVSSFFLDLKYNRSINNIVDDGSETVLKNNLYSLCVGVIF